MEDFLETTPALNLMATFGAFGFSDMAHCKILFIKVFWCYSRLKPHPETKGLIPRLIAYVWRSFFGLKPHPETKGLYWTPAPPLWVVTLRLKPYAVINSLRAQCANHRGFEPKSSNMGCTVYGCSGQVQCPVFAIESP